MLWEEYIGGKRYKSGLWPIPLALKNTEGDVSSEETFRNASRVSQLGRGEVMANLGVSQYWRFNYIMWVKQCHVYHPWLGMVSSHTTVTIKMVMTGMVYDCFTHIVHIYLHICNVLIEHIHRKVNTFFWHLFLEHVDPCPCWACTKMLVKYQWQIHPCLCNLMCFLLLLFYNMPLAFI